MLKNRAIIIFPRFENVEVINGIREKYDPLYSYIDPHVTLIFPFQSELSTDELREHVENKLDKLDSFELIAKGITGSSDGYVFLDVKVGNDNIIEIHDKLYSGILKPYYNRYIPYTPHITVGRLNDERQHREVIESFSEFNTEFTTVISKIVIECIDESEQSITELEYIL